METEPESPGVLLNYNSLVVAFSEFLAAALHLILFQRALYDEESFIRIRKYNFPVRHSRHPGVCKWIVDAVTAVEAEILKVRSWQLDLYLAQSLLFASSANNFIMIFIMRRV